LWITPTPVKKTLIGDIGYQTKQEKKDRLAKINVTMCTPLKRNQKKKNTIAEKQKLKKRIAIECKFSAGKTSDNRFCSR
jgi:hypothetical protein